MSGRMLRYEVPIDDEPHALETGIPLRVASRDVRTVEFWAHVADDHPARRRVFQVFGTGHPVPDGAIWCGTTERTVHGLVWHLFTVEA